MDDLAAILGGGAAAPKPRTYDPVDAAIRTVYGEAPPNATKEERQAIASVIVNRAKKSGKTFDQVVQEPKQFEPWNDAKARKRLDALKDTDPDYQSIAADVGDVLSGKANPHPDLTHFYAPEAQAALAPKDGRPAKPEWDDGTGKRIGAHLFFAKGDAPAAHEDLAGLLGAGPAPEAPTGTPEAAAPAADADQAFNEAFGDPEKYDQLKFAGLDAKGTTGQSKTFITMQKGGFLKPDQPLGSEHNPYGMQPGTTEKDVPAGAFYVDFAGKMKRAPGGEKHSSAAAGFGQGVGDVATSLTQLLPGSEDSEVRARLEAGQMAYDADLKGDTASGLGRFTGQMVGAVPLLAGGEAAAAPVLANAGAVGTFLAGKGGSTILGKGLSMAASGAGEGAGAAALTSSASDKPLGEQMAEGALAGAVLKPALPAVRAAGQKLGATVRSYAEPLTEAGRDRIASRIIGDVAGGPVTGATHEIIPGVKPTLGQTSENAGIAALERNARTNPRLAQKFLERDLDSGAARSDFYERLKGDEHTVKVMEDARDSVTGKLREAAFKGAGKADPAPVLTKIDEILASPAGQRDVVVKALNTIKGKLDVDGALQTDVEQLYGIRKAIGDLLSPLASNDAKGSQLASSELMAVKREIDGVIEKAAPGFRGYLDTYEKLSRPIDEQKLLQGLKITDARGNITLGRVQGAIDRVEAMRGKGGANKGKSVSASTLDQLKQLRDDLKRAGNLDLGKARGSDTVQNLVMGQVARGGGVPLGVGGAVPILGLPLRMAKEAYDKKGAQVLDAVGERLLNPNAAAPVVRKAPGKGARLLGHAGAKALPAAGAIGARSLGAQ